MLMTHDIFLLTMLVRIKSGLADSAAAAADG